MTQQKTLTDSEIFKKLSNESSKEYIIRMCGMKAEVGFTWDELAHIMNIELGENLSERTYRRKYDEWLTEMSNNDNIEEFLELKKERMRLQDERAQMTSLVRLQAREEMMAELAIEAAQKAAFIKPFSIPNKIIKNINKKEGILSIGDWHYGLEVDVFYNVYNPEICRERVKNLAYKCIDIIKKEQLTKLHIINLGDMISGRIHLPLRVNSRCDVVTQTMEVSELIADFLTLLSNYVKIYYHSVSDNHSRIEPKKKESLQTESFSRIIHWYLQERLKDNGNIELLNNMYGDDICNFDLFGHNVVAVHGDKDKTNKIISNLNLFLQTHIDMIFTAHFHHFSADESNGTIRFCNGSLMGSDEYSSNLRCNSKPSQLLVVSSEENITECVYKINV